jgi:hypothetical protein
VPAKAGSYTVRVTTNDGSASTDINLTCTPATVNRISGQSNNGPRMSQVAVPISGYWGGPTQPVTLEYQLDSGAWYEFGSVFAGQVTNGGSGYTAATIAFDPPPEGGVQALGTVVLTDGVVTGITMTERGRGYTSVPNAVITGDGTGATVVVRCSLVPTINPDTSGVPNTGASWTGTLHIHPTSSGTGDYHGLYVRSKNGAGTVLHTTPVLSVRY